VGRTFCAQGNAARDYRQTQREFTAIINGPGFRARFMVTPGLEPSEIGLADIKAFMVQDRAGWEPLVKTSGVQLQ
jgi:hypothetical protein